MSANTRMLKILELPKVIKCIEDIKQKTTNVRHETSLSSLLTDPTISHSKCIRLGIELENIFNACVESNIDEKYIRPNLRRNEKGKHQKDYISINIDVKRVLYAELKSNINLDTEKVNATIEKIKDIKDEYERDGYVVDAYLVSLRYLKTDEIPFTLKAKFKSVQLIGIQDFLTQVLSINTHECLNYSNYTSFLDTISSKL